MVSNARSRGGAAAEIPNGALSVTSAITAPIPVSNDPPKSAIVEQYGFVSHKRSLMFQSILWMFRLDPYSICFGPDLFRIAN